MKDILVVKIGGSCAASPDLVRWVAAIEQARLPIVVVPGGGPFANAVRRYQPRMGFGDEAAHEMAILAMEQFGCALVGLGRRMVKAADEAAIMAALERGDIPVWMPRQLVLSAPEIPKNWSVTSDSLAAWLAGRLPGARLCLFKQIDLPENATIDALAGAQIVDECFTELLDPATDVYVAGPADLSLAGVRLAEGEIPGHPVMRRRLLVAANAG